MFAGDFGVLSRVDGLSLKLRLVSQICLEITYEVSIHGKLKNAVYKNTEKIYENILVAIILFSSRPSNRVRVQNSKFRKDSWVNNKRREVRSTRSRRLTLWQQIQGPKVGWSVGNWKGASAHVLWGRMESFFDTLRARGTRQTRRIPSGGNAARNYGKYSFR